MNIQTLTPEQELQLLAYRQNWRQIALSTKPFEPNQAIAAVNALYQRLNQPEPAFVVCSGPLAACEKLLDIQTQQPLGAKLSLQIMGLFQDYLDNTVQSQPGKPIANLLHQGIYQRLYEDSQHFNMHGLVGEDLQLYQPESPYAAIAEEFLMGAVCVPAMHYPLGCLTEFCIQVLQCHADLALWAVLKDILCQTYWIFPFAQVCVLCDRPSTLKLDERDRLHAEGEAALRFADGYRLFAYHGVPLPKKYAPIHPNGWRSNWLLEEPNAELRRILIQGIGYGKICQELQAIKLDSWREYELLKIDSEIDIEPILVLKMTCPSTQSIHTVRVPPQMASARAAIRWVNHDIDPETFAVET
jgi:hypothetical protein